MQTDGSQRAISKNRIQFSAVASDSVRDESLSLTTNPKISSSRIKEQVAKSSRSQKSKLEKIHEEQKLQLKDSLENVELAAGPRNASNRNRMNQMSQSISDSQGQNKHWKLISEALSENIINFRRKKLIEILSECPRLDSTSLGFRSDKESKAILEILKFEPFFEPIANSYKLLLDISSKIQYRYFKKGETIYRINEFSDGYYVVIKGAVELSIPERVVLNENFFLGDEQQSEIVNGEVLQKEKVQQRQKKIEKTNARNKNKSKLGNHCKKKETLKSQLKTKDKSNSPENKRVSQKNSPYRQRNILSISKKTDELINQLKLDKERRGKIDGKSQAETLQKWINEQEIPVIEQKESKSISEKSAMTESDQENDIHFEISSHLPSKSDQQESQSSETSRRASVQSTSSKEIVKETTQSVFLQTEWKNSFSHKSDGSKSQMRCSSQLQSEKEGEQQKDIQKQEIQVQIFDSSKNEKSKKLSKNSNRQNSNRISEQSSRNMGSRLSKKENSRAKIDSTQTVRQEKQSIQQPSVDGTQSIEDEDQRMFEQNIKRFYQNRKSSALEIQPEVKKETNSEAFSLTGVAQTKPFQPFQKKKAAATPELPEWEDRVVKVVEEGECFGEITVGEINKRATSAQATADHDCHLILIKRQHFDIISKAQLVTEMKLIHEFLMSLPLFKKVYRYSIEGFLYYIKKVNFKYKEPLYKEGQPIKNIYILVDGEFSQSKIVNYKNAECKDAFSVKEQEMKWEQGEIYNLKTKKANWRSSKFKIISRGEMLGDCEVMEKHSSYTDSCQCITQSALVYQIDKKIFFEKLLSPENQVQEIRDLLRSKFDRKQAFMKQFLRRNLNNSLISRMIPSSTSCNRKMLRKVDLSEMGCLTDGIKRKSCDLELQVQFSEVNNCKKSPLISPRKKTQPSRLIKSWKNEKEPASNSEQKYPNFFDRFNMTIQKSKCKNRLSIRSSDSFSETQCGLSNVKKKVFNATEGSIAFKKVQNTRYHTEPNNRPKSVDLQLRSTKKRIREAQTRTEKSSLSQYAKSRKKFKEQTDQDRIPSSIKDIVQMVDFKQRYVNLRPKEKLQDANFSFHDNKIPKFVEQKYKYLIAQIEKRNKTKK